MSGNHVWIVFWAALLGITLLAYTILVVRVTLGGYRDIQEMFRKLRDQDEDGED